MESVNGHKLINKKFDLNMRKNIFTMWVVKEQNKEITDSPLLEIFKAWLDTSWTTSVADSAWEVESVGKPIWCQEVTSKPQKFCDSVNFSCVNMRDLTSSEYLFAHVGIKTG